MASYGQYSKWIEKLLEKAVEQSRVNFSRTAILVISQMIDPNDESLHDIERKWLSCLMQTMSDGEWDLGKAEVILKDWSSYGSQDEEHAIEIEPPIVDYLSAWGGYVEYNRTGDITALKNVGEAVMSLIDWSYHDLVDDSNWLDTPPVRAEYERQKASLGF